MRFLFAFGTRPEWIKLRPLIQEFRSRNIDFHTLFTGQHPDICIADEITHKINIGMNDDRLNSICATIFLRFKSIVYQSNILGYGYVIVQGDTTSSMCVALAAFNLGLKVIHLESGLRTYDYGNPFPEEMNRSVISKIASIHFCPTVDNYNNLKAEKILGDIYIVGNTSIDNLIQENFNCEYQDKVLVTLHRRENHIIMNKWLEKIENLARKYPSIDFIFPLHPSLKKYNFEKLFTYTSLLDPLSHEDLIKILTKCKIVITDSGGLQEECSFFNKICLVCRINTERPEALNAASHLVTDPEKLEEKFDYFIENYSINFDCPFGNGKTSSLICSILENYTKDDALNCKSILT